jgi:hypothetical protein
MELRQFGEVLTPTKRHYFMLARAESAGKSAQRRLGAEILRASSSDALDNTSALQGMLWLCPSTRCGCCFGYLGNRSGYGVFAELSPATSKVPR